MSRVNLQLATLPQEFLDTRDSSLKPKFAAYFKFTESHPGYCVRSIAQTPPGVTPYYVYPNESMISDLTFLSSLFIEMYESLKTASGSAFEANVQKLYSTNPHLAAAFNHILENGEYWTSHRTTERTLQKRIDRRAATPDEIPGVWRTLRNGFAHFHWHFDNLSAMEYWKARNWDTTSEQTDFGLQGRLQGNYTAYIADAEGWTPRQFWGMKDLRILVLQFDTLRYWLYVFFNILLNEDDSNVFGGEA